LEQEGITNTLSAPKVTTISGNTAQIKVVTVRKFPEDWEPPEVETGSGDNGSMSYTPATPTFGEETELGVILDVTPTVSANGFAIDMELSPQIIDFLGDDPSFNTVMILDGKELESKVGMTAILSERIANTKLVVWDGETVVLGGFIQEKLQKFEDKVPVLGSIPLLGHLFRSRGEKSVKTNMLIFVNARLVDSSGIPIRANDLRGLPDFRH
jgi:type II secretory pathway component GspD/PulD (secretin)